MFGKYQRLNRRLTKKSLHDKMNLHIFMCVDLPDQHTIHTIGAFSFQVLPALLLARGFFYSHSLIYRFLKYRTFVRFLIVTFYSFSVMYVENISKNFKIALIHC